MSHQKKNHGEERASDAAKDAENIKAAEEEVSAATEAEASSSKDAPDTAALEAQIKELQETLKDERVRAAANVQNISRRHQTEIEEAHKYAASKFAREILPVRDYLEMALKDESGNLEALKTGVELTLKHLDSAFAGAKIKEINPVGAAFDPNQHNAMSTEESDEKPNQVLRVIQKGYTLNGRVIRPATVVVAKPKEQAAAKKEEEAEADEV